MSVVIVPFGVHEADGDVEGRNGVVDKIDSNIQGHDKVIYLNDMADIQKSREGDILGRVTFLRNGHGQRMAENAIVKSK